jgi:5'-3' exonuclease
MVLLVDGNNLVNAAFYVAQAKANEANTEEVCEKTVNIFKSQIVKLQNDFSPSKIYIAWDGRNGSKWRKEILPEYKANRNKDGEEDLFECLNQCRELEENNNFLFDTFEGDDVIYALCRAIDNDEKIIISADKDFLQVIQEGLASKLFNQISKQYREIPEISSVIEKSICGDKSDNLLGVRGKGIAFVKKFVKRQVFLNEQEKEVFEKHKLVIGLRNNPHKDELLELVKKQLTIS